MAKKFSAVDVRCLLLPRISSYLTVEDIEVTEESLKYCVKEPVKVI